MCALSCALKSIRASAGQSPVPSSRLGVGDGEAPGADVGSVVAALLGAADAALTLGCSRPPRAAKAG